MYAVWQGDLPSAGRRLLDIKVRGHLVGHLRCKMRRLHQFISRRKLLHGPFQKLVHQVILILAVVVLEDVRVCAARVLVARVRTLELSLLSAGGT